jgi:hypothetical protein
MKKYSLLISILLGLFCVSTFAQLEKNWFLEYDSNGKCGYVDKEGNVKINFGKYINCFTDTFKNFAIVLTEKNGFVGIDKNERILYQIFSIDNGSDYVSEGLFRIILNKKIGFADTSGKIVIEPYYDAIYEFKEGLAAFCENCQLEYEKDGEHSFWTGGKWGIIDKNANIVIPAKYDNLWYRGFQEGKAKLELKGNIITIDKVGNEIKEK